MITAQVESVPFPSLLFNSQTVSAAIRDTFLKPFHLLMIMRLFWGSPGGSISMTTALNLL